MPKKLKAELLDKTRNFEIFSIMRNLFPQSNELIQDGLVADHFKVLVVETPRFGSKKAVFGPPAIRIQIEKNFWTKKTNIFIKFQRGFEYQADKLAMALEAALKSKSQKEWAETDVKFQVLTQCLI